MAEKKQIGYLRDKSIEAFLLSIEIFNKPTIKYRLEGCVFFLCNAWELLLKAKLLSDGKSIYYPDKDRTISLSDCIKDVFTNEKSPISQNLKVIVSLRNTSTHSIIPEYELLYMPFLAYCVKCYSDKLFEFFHIRISDYIKTDFLSLFVNNTVPDRAEMLSKYGDGMVSLFDKKASEMKTLLDCDEKSSIALGVTVNVARISNKSKADFLFYSTNNPENKNVMYIDRLVDANKTHSYTHHQIANEIDKAIKDNHIPFKPIKEPSPDERHPNPPLFTTACLDVYLKHYRIKEDQEYCIKIENGKNVVHKYSKKLVTKILIDIMDDPELIVIIHQKNKLTPGAKASRN